jgi:hypothetical protein
MSTILKEKLDVAMALRRSSTGELAHRRPDQMPTYQELQNNYASWQQDAHAPMELQCQTELIVLQQGRELA